VIDSRLPVGAIGGFLGAGKTTLLNHLLSDPHAPPTAVVVNEFGALGIDGGLIRSATGGVIELTNGCVCCEVREDLGEAVRRLLTQRARWIRPLSFERILIELSGLARPGPVVQTFQIQPDLLDQCRWQGLVTVVHGAHISEQLLAFPEAVEQVVVANKLILNHRDQTSPEQRSLARGQLEALNPTAGQVETENALVCHEALWAFSAQIAAEPFEAGVHEHAAVQSVSLQHEKPIDLYRLKMFLQFVGARHPESLLRVKGLFHCAGQLRPVLAQGVYQWLELGPIEGELPTASRLVVIGRTLKLDEIERGWAALA